VRKAIMVKMRHALCHNSKIAQPGRALSLPLIPALTFTLPNEIHGNTGHLKTEIAREMTAKK